MEKLLKKNGLEETRHQLKYSEVSYKNLSMGQSPNQSFMSAKRNLNQSRTDQGKLQSPDKDLTHIVQKVQDNQKPGFVRRQKPFSKPHTSKSEIKYSSNIQSAGKIIEANQIEIKSPNIMKKNSFSSKRQEMQTQPLPIKQGLQQNIQGKQNEKIQEIISFLRQKLLMKCTLQNHERNKILYVCLEPNCPQRIGCSYCFLHSHENHLKCEVSTCIKDLQELGFKVNANEQLFSNKVKHFYTQFSQKLDIEIQNIKAEFQTNLSFVKMYQFVKFRKVKNEFQSYYKEKYHSYLEAKQNDVSEFYIEIYSKDRQKTAQKGHNLYKTEKKKSNINDPVKEKELLTNLAGLKFDQVYSYLLKRSEILHLQSAESKVLLEFFQEMNSSLTKLFSAFKRNLPKIFAQRIFLQKPLIITCS